MAEIEVKKKKPVWPWIIGALVILVIIAFFVWDDDEEQEAEENIQQIEQYETDVNTANDYPENDVAEYLALVDEAYDEKLGEDDKFTSEALGKLVQAVEEKSHEMGVNPSDNLEKMTEDSTALDQEGELTIAATKIENTAREVVRNFEMLQEKASSDLSEEIADLKEDLNAITSAGEEDKKSEAVTAFFQQAAEVFRNMDEVEAGSGVSRQAMPRDTAAYSTEVDTITVQE